MSLAAADTMQDDDGRDVAGEREQRHHGHGGDIGRLDVDNSTVTLSFPAKGMEVVLSGVRASMKMRPEAAFNLIEADADIELFNDVVAGKVLHHLEIAEGDGEHLTAGVAQLHGPQADLRHRSLGGPRLDIVPHPEGVVDEKEDPGDDVLDQGLVAEADSQTDHAGAGDQRGNVDAERGQDDERNDHEKNGENELAKQHEKGRTAGADAASLLCVFVRQGHFFSELLVDAGLDQLPDDHPNDENEEDSHHVPSDQSPHGDVEAPQLQRGKKDRGNRERRRDFLSRHI